MLRHERVEIYHREKRAVLGMVMPSYGKDNVPNYLKSVVRATFKLVSS